MLRSRVVSAATNEMGMRDTILNYPPGPERRTLASLGVRLQSSAVVLMLAIAANAGALTDSARAQTASQITPQTFRPEVSHPGNIVVPAGAGLAAPAGAERLFVTLADVSVKGGRPELGEATAALVAALSGRRISGAEIFAAARNLEAAYAAAGFVLVRVILPPQTLVDGGRLTLTVVDGFIERIDTTGVPAAVRGRIDRLVAPLAGRHGLMLREIERRVLLAGDTAGVLLRSTLSAGRAEGATVLVLEAKYQPVVGLLTFDNTLSAALGGTTLGGGVDLNSVFGFGELVYLRTAGYPAGGNNGFFDTYPRNHTLAAGVVVPLDVWLDGLSFNVEATDARTTPKAVAGVQTTDTFDRLSFRLRYPWLRSRGANLYSEAALDVQDEQQSLFTSVGLIPLSLDRLRVMRFAADGDVITPWGAMLSGRAVLSLGIDGLGARSAADASPLLPLSRQGADAAFQKLDIAANYNQFLADHLAVNVAARAQTSFSRPMLHSEQIGIAGVAGLSALDAGSLVGDRGYVLRGELQSPWSLPGLSPTFGQSVGIVAAPYLFGAYGEVNLVDPTALEVASARGSSVGAGIRFGSGVAGALTNATLTLEYGHATRSDRPSAENRFTVVSAFRF